MKPKPFSIEPSALPTGWQAVTFAEDQPEYTPLPVIRNSNQERALISVWQLSWLERLMILWRGELHMAVYTFGQPLQPLLPSASAPYLYDNGGFSFAREHGHEFGRLMLTTMNQAASSPVIDEACGTSISRQKVGPARKRMFTGYAIRLNFWRRRSAGRAVVIGWLKKGSSLVTQGTEPVKADGGMRTDADANR